MKRIAPYLALVLISLLSSCVAPQPKIVLEATNTVEDSHWRQETLFLRLFSDGTIQWEERTRETKVLHTAKIETIEVTEFVDSVKKAASELPTTLGPYNTYTDTVVHFRIRISAPGLDKSMNVANPWPCTLPSCSLGAKITMPAALSTVLCEIQTMHNRVAQDKAHWACPKPENQKSH